MCPKKEFKYRPLLNEEQYAIVICSLFTFLEYSPLGPAFDELVSALLEKKKYKPKKINRLIKLVAFHWTAEAFLLWDRLLEKEPKRRRTEEIVKRIFSKRFGDRSYNEALKQVREVSDIIIEHFRERKDLVLKKLRELET